MITNNPPSPAPPPIPSEDAFKKVKKIKNTSFDSDDAEKYTTLTVRPGHVQMESSPPGKPQIRGGPVVEYLGRLNRLQTLCIDPFLGTGVSTQLDLRKITQLPKLPDVVLMRSPSRAIQLHVPVGCHISIADTSVIGAKMEGHLYKDRSYVRSETLPSIFYNTNPIKIENYNDKPEAEYCCRHAAMEDLLLEDLLKKDSSTSKKTVKKYKNRADCRNKTRFKKKDWTKIKEARRKKMESLYQTFCDYGEDNYIVSNKGWNKFCAFQLAKMGEVLDKSNEEKLTRTFLVRWEEHAMTLRLVVKGRGGARRYAISLFDPNQTTTDTRVRYENVRSVTDVGARPLLDLVSETTIRTCFKEKNEGIIKAETQAEGDVAQAETEARKAVEQAKIRAKEACTHFIRAPEGMTEEGIENLKGKPPKNRNITYDGEEVCSNPQSLYFTMYANLLSSGRMEELTRKAPADAAAFLSAKGTDGCSGLYSALELGFAETVKAYMEGLHAFVLDKREILTKEQIQELLLAKDGRGTPGVYKVLEPKYEKVFSAYMDGLARWGGSTRQAIETAITNASVGQEKRESFQTRWVKYFNDRGELNPS